MLISKLLNWSILEKKLFVERINLNSEKLNKLIVVVIISNLKLLTLDQKQINLHSILKRLPYCIEKWILPFSLDVNLRNLHTKQLYHYFKLLFVTFNCVITLLWYCAKIPQNVVFYFHLPCFIYRLIGLNRIELEW